MTILPFGLSICIECKAPVAIVRRTVELPCTECEEIADGGKCRAPTPRRHDIHTHTIPDIGPATVVDEDGARHLCGIAQTERLSDIPLASRVRAWDNPGDGSSVTDSDTMCDGRTTARSSGAAVSRLEDLAP
jgi:hypothetical protein